MRAAPDRSRDRNTRSRRAQTDPAPRRSAGTRASSLSFEPSQSSASARPRVPCLATIACVASLALPPASSVRIPARPRCSSLPSQTAPNGSGEPNARGPAGGAPEALRELQQRLGGPAVLEPHNRLVLLRRERRRNRDTAQQSRRQREDRIVAVDLRERAIVLDADPDHFSPVRDRDEVGIEMQTVAERLRQAPK